MPPRPVVLVTGAARRIGRVIALDLAAHGYDIALHCHAPSEESATTFGELRDQGARAEVFAADLADEAACRALLPRVAEAFGRVDALVNNASRFAYDDVAGFGHAEMDAHWRVNTAAPILLARALHDLSPRANERFVAINCAAIPENLLESELFGYEKGAFTGAGKQTKGKIEYADHGTLFLDEVGDLPFSLQAKLLRFLQERIVERLGGREEIAVDVRVVCATHQDLRRLIEAGRFREDLFYRISEITINIPPLREREGDSILLAHAFLEKFSQQYGKALKGFTPDACAAIEHNAWPGNVREMENCIKRAVIMSEDSRLSALDLGLEVGEEEPAPLNLRQARETAEREAVTKAISRAGGNIARAAELLGVSRPTLYDLLNRFGIQTKEQVK